MNKFKSQTVVGLILFSCLLAFCAPNAWGNILTLQGDYVFGADSVVPVGASPWITATFDDHGGTGSVTLTLAAAGLTGVESVLDWDFNIDPSFAPSSLVFSSPTKTGSFDTPSISLGEDAYKADGDGKYDIDIAFTQGSNTGNTFSVGDTLSYDITRAGITANSFDCLSTPAGGAGPFLMAAHIQNTPNTAGANSAWVAPTPVPEPSMWCFAIMGMAGATLFYRGKR